VIIIRSWKSFSLLDRRNLVVTGDLPSPDLG
jgi:hypothetical protein